MQRIIDIHNYTNIDSSLLEIKINLAILGTVSLSDQNANYQFGYHQCHRHARKLYASFTKSLNSPRSDIALRAARHLELDRRNLGCWV